MAPQETIAHNLESQSTENLPITYFIYARTKYFCFSQNFAVSSSQDIAERQACCHVPYLFLFIAGQLSPSLTGWQIKIYDVLWNLSFEPEKGQVQ